MTDKEIEKRIEFIIEQQAQFATDIQVLREIQTADRELQQTDAKLLKEKHNNLTEALTTVVGIVGRLAAAQELTDGRLAELAEAQVRTNERVSEIAERLNVFIDVVEKYISSNGSAKNSS
jgi:chromosome segregation ATPase